MAQPLRFAAVVSTGGAVLNEVVRDGFLRDRLVLAVADRPCEAVDKLRAQGVRVELVERPTVDDFGDALLDLLVAEGVDYVLSYYVEFFSAPVREAYRDRILNFHPSLLPAFKGMDGFGDAVRYPVRITGNTVELIAEVMDEGKIVMQTACPVDTTRPLTHTRHRVFEQQCKALLQVVRWLEAGRVVVDGHTVAVRDARFDGADYSPALDDPDVIRWRVPPPPPEAVGT